MSKYYKDGENYFLEFGGIKNIYKEKDILNYFDDKIYNKLNDNKNINDKTLYPDIILFEEINLNKIIDGAIKGMIYFLKLSEIVEIPTSVKNSSNSMKNLISNFTNYCLLNENKQTKELISNIYENKYKLLFLIKENIIEIKKNNYIKEDNSYVNYPMLLISIVSIILIFFLGKHIMKS
jgi:hypothetical protein